ncbi:MAG: rhomboid family intramembrane serine protease [Rhodospirillaceae bacterium]|nr:rhomboid family intramembrane serine protease [Rhodospirillaceae bacterium]
MNNVKLQEMKSRVLRQWSIVSGIFRHWASVRARFAPSMISVSGSLYGLALFLQPEATLESRSYGDVLTPGARALLRLGMTGDFAMQRDWWWTLFTAIYLHGAWWQLAWNSVCLWAVGGPASTVYGFCRTFIVFNLAGASGFLISNLWSGAPTVGAHGAVYGLVAALVVYESKSNAYGVTRRVWWALGVVLTVYLGGGLAAGELMTLPAVGGLLGGACAAQVVGTKGEARGRNWVVLGAAMIGIIVVAGMGLSFVKSAQILGPVD